MNDKYLYSLDEYMTNLIKKNLFHTCLEEVCKRIGTTYELYDYDKVNRFIYDGDGEILDVYKAAGIWFVQAVEALNIKMSIPTYAAVLNQFDEGCILVNFAVGYILKYIDIEGTSLRDAIIRHPLCSDVNKLWRWYDFLNVNYIKYYGSPMIYSSDKYSPLVNIFGDTQIIRINIDATDYQYDAIICDSLIIHNDESDEVKHKKIQFIKNIYRAIFLTYTHYFARWIEDNDSGMYPLPNNLLLNGSYFIRKANHLLTQTFETETRFDDYSDKILESINVYYIKKMSEFPDKTLLATFNNWLTSVQINYYDEDAI